MATVLSPSQLTAKDARVLTALFDPEAASDTQAKEVDTSPAESQRQEESQDHSPYPDIPSHKLPEILAAERAALFPLNDTANPTLDAISATLNSLSHLIARFPLYPPSFVNRAQARRMLWQHKSHSFPKNKFTDEKQELDTADAFNNFIKGVLDDLDEAIRLISPSTSYPASGQVSSDATPIPPPPQNISQQQARLLSVARTHRGYTLLQLAARASTSPTKSESPQTLTSRHPFQSLSKAQLEEMASHDFAVAGRYGDKTAKEAAVALNPYARMCGAIVKNAMKEEFDFALGNSQ